MCHITLLDGTVLKIRASGQKRLVTDEEKHGRGVVNVESENVPEDIQVADLKFDGVTPEKPQRYTKDKEIVRLAKELVDACRQGKFEEKEVTLDG